jgi:hypothetical protein
LDYVPVLDKLKRDTSWSETFKFLQMDSENAKVRMSSGELVNYIPLKKVSFEVKADGKIGRVPVSLNERLMYKHQLVFWDIISSNASKRPVCFVSKYEAQKHGLSEYLQCEGFVYRLIPEKHKNNAFTIGKCDPNKLYAQLMEDAKWGNIAQNDVYVCWNTIVNFNTFQVRNIYNETASLLLKEGDKAKAGNLLKKSAHEFPLSKIPHDVFCIRQLELMLQAGLNDDAVLWYTKLEQNITENLEYFTSLNSTQQISLVDDIQREMAHLNQLTQLAAKLGDDAKRERLKKQLEYYYNALIKR